MAEEMTQAAGMGLYRLRAPIHLQAIQWTGDNDEAVRQFAGDVDLTVIPFPCFLVRGVTGQLFTVEPDRFGGLYEAVAGAPEEPHPGARQAAEAAYLNWRIGDDGEGGLHAALLAYVAAAQADADQSLADRMAAMEETIRAGERERIAQLAEAGDVMVWVDDDGSGIAPGVPFASLIRKGADRG